MTEAQPIGSERADPAAERPRKELLLDALRNLVLEGTYLPGAALSEVRLAREFQTSRTPVREALKQLQIEGLVEIRPKVGTFVRTPTRREIVEMFQIKESLEGLAAGLMAQRGPVPELATLERNVAESVQASRSRNPDAYAQLVQEFHQTLVDGSDNTKLQDHYRTLMNQLAYVLLVNRTLHQPGRLERSVEEHRLVVACIAAKDSWGAEQAMRDHVRASTREALTHR